MDYISSAEVDAILGKLSPTEPSEFGGEQWLRQYASWSKLNVQAHISSSQNPNFPLIEEFQNERLASLLVRELVLSDVWRLSVMPKIQAKTKRSVKFYFARFQEVTLLNLFELLSVNQHVVQAVGQNSVDLADYCYSKASQLLAKFRGWHEKIGRDEHVDEHCELDLSSCLLSLVILRNLADNLKTLPVSIVSFLLKEKDVLMLLVALIEERPWFRKNEKGREQFVNNRFVQVESSELDAVNIFEAQVWIAILHFFFSEEAATSYEITDYRKNQLLRLKKYLNEVLVDQIPALASLQRSLEQLSIANSQAQVAGNPFVIQSVPSLMTELAKAFESSLDKQIQIFSTQYSKKEQSAIEELCDSFSQPIPEARRELGTKCACCGSKAEKRCSRCKKTWYCSKECQVKDFKAGHKAICKDPSSAKATPDIKLPQASADIKEAEKPPETCEFDDLD